MKTIIYLILGLVQGITEPIPISSSGHLVILSHLFDNKLLNDLNFEIIVNFGSLLAIIFFFRHDLKVIINDFFSYLKTKNKQAKENFKYGWLIILGTLPAALIGFFLKNIIETNLSNVKLIGASFIVTALFLYAIRNIKGQKQDRDLTIKEALIIGLFQVIALFPGISRSGATIVGGMFNNLKRETAFKFSFMLYIPISIATMIVGVKDLIVNQNLTTLLLPYTLSMILATIATYYALIWFKEIMKKGKLIYFSYYCLIIGLLVLFFL